MTHIIDIILIAIILLIVLTSVKRGIILTVFDLASGVISFLAAKLLSPKAAEYIYDAYLSESVSAFLSERYSDAENAASQAADSIASVFDFLPDGVLEYADSIGLLSSDNFSPDFLSGITTVEALESDVVYPVVTALLNIVCFAVIAIVLVIVLRVVGKLFSKLVNSSKIAKGLDSLLGAVFGILKGGLYALIIASVISIAACSSEALAEYAADSYICAIASKIIFL